MKLNQIPEADEVPYTHFEDTALAFDGYITLYQFLTAITRDGDYVRNTDDKPISHLLGILNRFGTLLEHGVKPIVVLDGGYPDLKDDLVAERAASTQDARQQYLDAKEQGDVEGMKQYHRQRVSITDFIEESAKQAFDAMGIPYVEAPSEGEPQAAQLVAEGHAQYPVTEDYDVVLYHPSMVRSFGHGSAEILDFANPLREMGWSHDELIWHSIVLGTDYNTSPYGVGPVGAKTIVDEADEFTDVVEQAHVRDQRDRIDPERWWATYEWCTDPDVKTDVSIEHGEFDPDAFREVMVEEYQLLSHQVESKIESILGETHEADA